MSNKRSPRRNRRAMLALVAVATLATAACSGGSDATDDAPTGGANEAQAANADNCPVDALDAADEPVELTIWHPYNASTKQALEAIAEDYNASQDDVVVAVENQGTYAEELQKYKSASLGDPASLPDLIFSEDTTLQFMADSGTVVATSDCIAADPDSADFYDQLLPAVRNQYSIAGTLWSGAYGVSMPVMYVNRAHLAAAGLDTTELPGTLAELRSTAEALSADGIPSPIVMQLDGWQVENWITGAKQVIVDNDNGRSGLATASEFISDASTEIVDWLQSMAADGLLKAFPKSSGIDQFQAMANQSSSILIDGSRAIVPVDLIVRDAGAGEGLDGVDGIDAVDPELLKGIDLTVAPIAGLEAPGQGAVAGSQAFVVAGADERIAAAWDFLKYFNQPANQVRWTLEGSYLPVTDEVQNAPEVTAYFAGERAGQWLEIVNDQLLSVDPDFPGAAIGPYNEFRLGLQTALDKIVLGDAEPRSTIETFDSQFQDALDSYRADVGG